MAKGAPGICKRHASAMTFLTSIKVRQVVANCIEFACCKTERENCLRISNDPNITPSVFRTVPGGWSANLPLGSMILTKEKVI